MQNTVKHARWIFKGAGIYGLIVLLPLYFLEGPLFAHFPPPPNRPDHFYGLVGVAVAWQIAFVVIGGDPVKYRALMPAAMVEKFSYVGALAVLYGRGRIPIESVGPGVLDGCLGLAFVYAWFATRSEVA